ncbi:MAG: TonB-dependent receptor [Amphiplicatus sp.]
MLREKPRAGVNAQHPDTTYALLSSAALPALLFAIPAHAQNSDTIVVSATKSPLPLSQVGSAVSVIEADEIAQRQYQFVADALSQTAGLAIARNGSLGGQAALRIRGEAAGRTLVIIDGVVVNDASAPGGGFNFANLDAADVERIEIIRGPQSILYGSEAIGGVVSITTKRGDGAPEAQLFLEGGSFATFRGGASVTGAAGAADYGVTVSGITSNGVSRADGGDEADGIDAYTASANLDFDAASNLRFETSLRYNHTRTDFDGFPPPAFELADTDDEDISEEFLAAGRALLTLFEGKLENIVTVGYHRIDRESVLGDVTTFEGEGDRLSAEYLARFKLSEKISLVAGAEHERTHTDTSGIEDAVDVNSVFGLVAVTPVKNLTFTAGGRHDDHETFGGATTARVTAAYYAEQAGLVLRGSWGEGFAAPSLFQLNFVCCGGTTPNRDLQPETSDGWDAGFDKTLGDIATFRATYFHQSTENQIDFDFASGAYVNIASTVRKGVEAELALRPLAGVDVSVSYAYIDATDRITGLPLLRQPKHAVALNGDWRVTDRFSLGATFRYNGEEADGGGPIDDWMRVDLRASYAATESLELFGRIENAFDADYQDVLFYGEPGVAAFGGVRVRI